MGVRIPVELKKGDRVVRTVALVNSGYETDEAEIHIPLALARKLGFALESIKSERYRVVGSEVTTYVLGTITVRVLTEDRSTGWVNARAVSVPGEYEVILSDALTEELGVVIVKPRSGLWRFVDEEKVRESEEPVYWVE